MSLPIEDLKTLKGTGPGPLNMLEHPELAVPQTACPVGRCPYTKPALSWVEIKMYLLAHIPICILGMDQSTFTLLWVVRIKKSKRDQVQDTSKTVPDLQIVLDKWCLPRFCHSFLAFVQNNILYTM